LLLISLTGYSSPAEGRGRIERSRAPGVWAAPRARAGRFAASGRPGARLLLDDAPHRRGAHSGALIPDAGLAAMECEVSQRVPAGDHLLVIARVLFVGNESESGDPLVRFRGRYLALAR
jgi:flavin reductase (DIM6/NTAB) family NADH-FMN oxidoreductase RutF